MRITAQAKAETLERLLDAAGRRLRRSPDLTTREVASEAGVAHGTLFNYFPTKEALARAVCERELVAAAEAFVQTGAWISHLVLMKAVWVLDSVYGVEPEQIGNGVEMLLDHNCMVVQDADVVRAAVAQFREHPGLGFSDCLILEVARAAGHVPLGTFDRGLGKLQGAQKL